MVVLPVKIIQYKQDNFNKFESKKVTSTAGQKAYLLHTQHVSLIARPQKLIKTHLFPRPLFVAFRVY
jgi:hypothetical protein